MRIFRGPRTTNKWQATDSKSLKTWAKQWRPGKHVQFDGTINKIGERHTDLGVELTEDDLNELVGGLIKYYRTMNRQLTKERDQLREAVTRLEEALGKISSLATY